MKNTLRLFLPLLLLAVLVAACGNTTTDGFEDQNNGLGVDETPMFEDEPGVGEPLTGTEGLEPTDPMTGTEGDEPGLLGELEVDIRDFFYDPQDLRVQVGDTVTWTNNDTVAHTVTAGTPDNPTGEFDSGEIQPGETFTYTFDQAGTFDYYCTLHPDMTGSVTVEDGS
jgi:plastocyanin